jgi:hypothetical protein
MATPITLNGKHIQGKCADCSAEPNPTKGKFELKIPGLSGLDLRFKLFNLDGKVIRSHTINSLVTSLSICNCKNGIYFLKVMNGETQSKLIRIIKT